MDEQKVVDLVVLARELLRAQDRNDRVKAEIKRIQLSNLLCEFEEMFGLAE